MTFNKSLNFTLLTICFRVNWEENVARSHILNVTDTVSSINTANHTDIPDNIKEKETRHTYIVAYCQILALFAVFYSWRTFAFFSVCLRASIKLHEILFKGITEARMFFYHSNTSGRILNRFSKDIGNVDTLLPQCLLDCSSVRSQNVLRKEFISY